MDPITAFGVAANILQLLTIGVEVSKRIKDFSSSHLELPEALRDVAAKLNLLNDVLGRIQREIDRHPDAFSASTIRSLTGVINDQGKNSTFSDDTGSGCAGARRLFSQEDEESSA